MDMKRRAAVCLVLAAAVLGPASVARAQAPATIATVDRPTPVAAFGGRVAWSVFDAANGTYALVSRAGGLTATVPVPPRRVPFDVDLGPGPDGGVVAVYSRCDRDPPAGGGSIAPPLYNRGVGCDIVLFDFATGAERPVADANSPTATEFFPTIWRNRIAFARTYDDKRAFPYVYTRAIGSRVASRRLPGGQRNACLRNRNTGRTSCSPNTVSRPMALDLWGRRLAFAWTFAGFGEGLDTEIRLDTIGADHRVVAHQGGGGLTQIQLGWPGFENGRVYWVAGCFGDPAGCPGRVALRRYRITTREVQSAPAPAEAMVSHDRDAGTSYVLFDRAAGTDCTGDPAVPGGTCVLQSLAPVFG
jgi:hypothetical protein